MQQKIFIRVKFLDICTKISKKCQYHEDFLTKFLNINNHTPYFLNRVVILREAKNYSLTQFMAGLGLLVKVQRADPTCDVIRNLLHLC